MSAPVLVSMSLARLNWGCGPRPVPGWTNLDRIDAPGIDVRCDLLDGIPLPDQSFDYAVGIHVLQDLPWPALPRALDELRRVLKPGGVLRLGLPDLDRAIDAYRRSDHGYFYVRDEDARSIGAKLVTQVIWYGNVRTPFTADFAEELLDGAAFRQIRRCAYGRTHSAYADIVSLDNRERESFYMEACR